MLIKWSLGIDVPGGPKIAAPGEMEVGAFDQVDETIPANQGKTVYIQPGTSVQLLFIKPGENASQLKYKQDDQGQDARALDQPLLVLGADSIKALFGEAKSLFFLNDGSEDTSVRILAGRPATE